MKSKRIVALIMTFVLCIGLFSACGQSKTPTAPEAPASEQPADTEGEQAEGTEQSEGTEDTLVFNVSAVVKTLDPALNNATDGAMILVNLWEGLYMLDENDMPYPAAAESCDISGDGLMYTFHLRDGIKWSDGEPVLAKDFEFAWKRALSPETAAEYAYLLYYIKGGEDYNNGKGTADDVQVHALDDKTLQVVLEAPTKYFLSLAAFPAYFPVREDVVADERWTLSPETYISNGKYTMAEINDKENFLLTINENYWNKETIKLKYVDVRQVEDDTSGFATFKTGEFDIQRNVPTPEVMPGVAEGLVTIFPYTGTYFAVLNVDLPKASAVSKEAAEVLQDVKVRQALALAINRDDICEFVRMDGSTPAFSYVPPAVTNSDGSSFAQTQYFPSKGDPEKAKALLAEAGFPDGKGFPKLNYIYNAGASHENVAQAIQGMWKEVLNIDCELKNGEWAAVQTLRDNHDYIIARHGWIADYNDPTTFLEMWLSGVGQNNAGYNNTEYDNLLKQAQKESNDAKRDELLHQAEDLLMADMPIIPIFYYTNPMAVQPYVKGLRVSPLCFVYFDQVVIEK